jgi:hypothetical protein
MRSKFYPVFFDNDIVGELIERILIQSREADVQLYENVTGGCIAFFTTPENMKAGLIREVLEAFSKYGGRGPVTSGAAGAIQMAYYLSRGKLRGDELEQILQDWKCIR